MQREEYESIIQEAITALPEQFKAPLSKVIIVIKEDAPLQSKGILLGLFEGVPLTAWGKGTASQLPDTITIFTKSIERVAPTPVQIPDIVRETLWHEIAHFFGFDHDHIDLMEDRWRTYRNHNKE